MHHILVRLQIRVGFRQGKEFSERAEHDQAVSDALTESGAKLICLAGYMRILGDDFLQDWRGRLINIHPSLLPSFRGVDTHERALERGVRFHGCTVHFVNSELDGGPIIAQTAIAVSPEDTADTLSARVLDAEHLLYPHALELIASEKVRWRGDDSVVDSDVTTQDVAQFAKN